MLLLFLLLSTGLLQAQVGCMDDSHHSLWCNDGPEICCKKDYKKLHYVPCTCPCKRYPRARHVKKCLKCNHYYRPGYADYLNH